ncbi:hypothetical protein [Kitasatospora purpeofusca]|uniref:hypothetical protein n=1 Tax=Kitasatospora purpeofusca TaxID=67352 RepID=UPI0036D35529
MTIQTFPGAMGEPVAFRAALLLYPARYRRERGDEMSAVFADSTARAGRLATAREAFDLGAYGLRVRTGLTSSSLAGRLLAVAAPLVAGAIAGQGLARAAHDALQPSRYSMFRVPHLLGDLPGYFWYVGQVVVPLLLAAAVLAGWWRLARVAAFAVATVGVLGLLWAVAIAYNGWDAFLQSCEATPQLFAGLLVALVPKDLLERPAWRDRVLVAAAAVGGWLVLVAEDFYSSWVLMDGVAAGALLLVPLAALLFTAREWLLPAAAGLAVLALTLSFSLFRLWQVVGGMWRLLPVAGAVLVVLSVAGRLLRRGADGAGGGRSLA